MKSFVQHIAIYLFIIVVIDYFIGVICGALINHAAGGDTKRMSTIIDEVDDDILVFGSSRACLHYDPLIIQDSLHASCYNVGREGTGSIIYNWGQYQLIRSRYKPKIIIYDVFLRLDLLKDDNTRYLEPLKRYYGRPTIDSIFYDVDKTLRIKMASQMYRYNGSFVRFISDNIRPMGHYIKGYNPIDEVMDYDPNIDSVEEEYAYDSLKLEYWQQFIADCKRSGTKLILMMSPIYKATPQDIEPYQPIMDIAKKNGIPFICHYDDTAYCTRRKYFKDSAHLNRLGATTYTRAIIKELRPFI